MKIQIKGLQAPYQPQQEVVKQIERAQIGRRYIYRIVMYMVVLSAGCALFQMTPSNQTVLSTIIIVFNLLILVMMITMNEKFKSILQTGLENVGRYEESKRIKVGYTKVDKVIIASALIQVILQVIQIVI